MKKSTTFACLALILVWAVAAMASTHEDINFQKAFRSVPVGLPGGAAKDTVDMIGPYPVPVGAVCDDLSQPWNGTFETVVGANHWSCWTHKDNTAADVDHWQVSTYHAVTGMYSAWCGAMIPPCDGVDPPDEVGGYGNSWTDWLGWYGTVPNPSASTIVGVEATANIDTEIAYDFVKLYYEGRVGMFEVASWDGPDQFNQRIEENFTVTASDYVGADSDQIHLRFEFTSDVGWSDEDCSFYGTGAIQLDDVLVTFNGTPQGTTPPYIATFESGGFEQGWHIEPIDAVGDFCQLQDDLEDIDPCRSNSTTQAIFIDDGEVVPGTGGTDCISWCYGPGGYIVTTEGGLAGPTYYIDNSVVSPYCEWPDQGLDGCDFTFSVYRHETLSATSPGIFYTWHVRSVNTDVALDLEDAAWLNRNFVSYGGPDYLRQLNRVTDLLEPGRTHVQCRMSVFELGYVWGWTGNDGYPAPYFDNVRLTAFPYEGPGLSTREIDIFNDQFPENGSISYSDLARNSCRVDIARNISPGAHLRIDHGDTATFDINPVRAGSTLEGTPVIVYKMDPNPLYNPVRSGFPLEGTNPGVDLGADRWAFDLPDTGWFFPGDVIHWYIEAQDNQGGNIGTANWPLNPDLDNYNDFSDGLDWNSSNIIRALPTMFSATAGDQPKILWWNDFANRGLENEWYMAFRNLGYAERVDYDVYYTNGPDSGVGNGLGAMATTTQLDGYDVLLYSAGDMSVNTIANADYANDASNDVALLDNFLQNGKKAYLSGDDLVFDMVNNGGTETATFASYWINVNHDDQDLAPLIDDQIAPTVRSLSGNSVFPDDMEWVAYGGCLAINTFDAVTVNTGCEQLAEFLDEDGNGGAYPYAAFSYNYDVTYDSHVIYSPYDFGYIYTPAKVDAPTTARAQVMERILFFFNVLPTSPITDVPTSDKFMARNYPNPFNPSTKIEFNLPQTTHLSVKIFNVRGELVTTLIDEERAAGSDFVIWNGQNDRGDAVASGVYFYEVRTPTQSLVDKMTLLK